MIVYKTTNIVTNIIYVGADRKNNPNYLGSGTLLLRAIKKYGRENFKKEVLEICDNEEVLFDREVFWIKELNATDRSIGYNIVSFKFAGKMESPSEETRMKLSNALKGKKKPEGYGEKYSGKGSARYVEIPEDQVIELYKNGSSLTSIGKVFGVSKTKISCILSKNKIDRRTASEACSIRPKISEETKQKMRDSHKGSKNPMFGKSLHDVWTEKHGIEKANQMLEEYKQKMKISLNEI